MQVFDASSMIYAWDNYPISQFPGLWDWMTNEIEIKNIAIPRVAIDEISHKYSECSDLLNQHSIQILDVTNAIIHDAFRIKGLIGVYGDNYGSSGVDENDLLIIATARAYSAELVSDEAKQPSLPKNPANKKIPAVCDMTEVSVQCVNFLEYIKNSGVVFR